MTDYTKLVAALRCENAQNVAGPDCAEYDCYANRGKGLYCQTAKLLSDAADAIEVLQAELEDKTNAIELWKDMYVTKDLPQDEKDRILAHIRNAPIGPIEQMRIEQMPKLGEWKTTRPDAPMFGFYYCSICGRKRTSPQDNYCPNCGAKMTEVRE